MLTLTTFQGESAQQPPAHANASPDHAAVAALAAETAHELSQLFKLLADESRVRILYFLFHAGELNVRTICGLLAQSQPAVSHHLALLKEAGVIECRRDGKHNYYRLVPRRCQQYLNCVFGVTAEETRRIRVDDAVLTYGREGEPAQA